MTTNDKAGQLIPLSDEECWDLVRSSPVGRLAWHADSETSVVPLNFEVDTVDERQVIRIRTSPYSALARDCVDRDVAFEVDRIDPEHRGGWSVLLRGRCTHEGHAADGPQPWAAGSRMLGLSIQVRSVSGRRVVGEA